MAPVILYPGFPLPDSDYDALVRILGSELAGPGAVRVAHSFGSFAALRDASRAPGLPTVLLAPSTPRRRRGRAATRFALALAGRLPIHQRLADRMRAATYERYGAPVPMGSALPLREAAARLDVAAPTTVSPVPDVVVICSPSDPRRDAQLQLAESLGARVAWVDGGHLFPITEPHATAHAIIRITTR